MDNIRKISIEQFILDSYIKYGKESNLNKNIPNVFDGNKPVYNILIQIASQLKDGFCKKNVLLGELLKLNNYNVLPILNEGVKNGIFLGDSIFCNNLYLSNLSNLLIDSLDTEPKYTKIKLHPKIRELQQKYSNFIPEYPYDINNNIFFKQYIPTPIPFCLIMGGSGIGVGEKFISPAFTPKSLVDAYLKNDPLLLQANYGYTIKDEDELRSIWSSSDGYLTYNLLVYEGIEDNKKGYYLEGSTEIFTPNISKLVLAGKNGNIYINSSINPLTGYERIFFARYHDVDLYSDKDIYNMVLESSVKRKEYRLRVVHNDQVRPITLKDWLDITMTNFSKLIIEYQREELMKINFMRLVWGNFISISKLIFYKQLSYQEISDKLLLDIKVVLEVSKMSLDSLVLNYNFINERINILNNQEKEILKINPIDEVTDFIYKIDSKAGVIQ